ncbi:hypothetical protein FRC11_001541 [Ceratobasidium sp. 423]|nr:hypothetical protein FRC11_001541 [Ceratobasidium sp. 423]
MAFRRKLQKWKDKLEGRGQPSSGSGGATPNTSFKSVTPMETTERSGSWEYLRIFVRVLDESSGVFGPLKAVMNGLQTYIDKSESIVAGQKEYKELKIQLEGLFKDLSGYFSEHMPPGMTVSMENLCRAIGQDLGYIYDKQGRSTLGRHLQAEQDLDSILQTYRRVQSQLERLKLRLTSMKLNVDMNIWRVVDEQATENRLKGINPAMSAYYNSASAAVVRRRDCTPMTREQMLAKLESWARDANCGKICWMNGMAGTGKTTIANTFCAMLGRTCGLGASFFCSRLLPECRDVKLIFPTIAYQLARFSRPFRNVLSQVLERDPDIYTRALRFQFDGMILGPLREVARSLPTGVVVVIDALDECDDVNGVGQVLDTLLAFASETPIKFLVSSRPEPQIRRRVGNIESQLILHELDHEVVQADIATYLRAELASMFLSDLQMSALVERAGILFIFAATLVRYIDVDNALVDSRERLDVILSTPALSSTRNKDIDTLYHIILAAALGSSGIEPWERERIKLVLDTVICAQEPLTVDALAGLLDLGNAGRVSRALEPLWSVLHVSRSNGLVSTLHASFPDYILDRGRSKEYWCDPQAHNGKLAALCLERIRRNERQFNICDIKSSYVPDDQVPGLRERINQEIPLELMYACCYWSMHLDLGGPSPQRADLLFDFISERLLLWMEVLNLKKCPDLGGKILEQARKWCAGSTYPPELEELLYDAWRFVLTFATSPVSRCTPHLYVSMLASWPLGRLTDYYLPRIHGLTAVTGTAMERRQVALLGAFPSAGCVHSVSFSPDGTRIATGSHDGKIRIWDSLSIHILLDSSKSHVGYITSIAFSPDGKRIASCASDKTICVWDADALLLLVGPLEGHTETVESVSFSPEGAVIVSGAQDCSIRLWDAWSGQLMGSPLEGHTGTTNSVAFLPDGVHIVSGSYDKTLRVWNTQTRQMVVGPFIGHTNAITSITISPDGTRVVSGSHDATVCVWDVWTGAMIIGPLKGHSKFVSSVAFSPDGSHIVSGSYDLSMCRWDSQDGKMISSPFEGHTNWVDTVAFSPNGMHIVSGGWDGMYVWDAQSRQTLSPVEGHNDRVTAVAFSPDGKSIVSGSWDKTVRVWSTRSENKIIRELKGHASPVNSVSFSRDGTRIAAGYRDHTLCVWDAENGLLVTGPLEGHTGEISDIAFSPDGMSIISSSGDRTIRIWDVLDGRLILGPLWGHTEDICAVAFSPDGKHLASGGVDKNIFIWDAQDGHIVFGPLNEHTDQVTGVTFSPDGKYLASCSDDRTIRLWDPQTGKMVLDPIVGHDHITSVAFSPDGKLITAVVVKTLCVWEVRTKQMIIGPLEGHINPACPAAFSSDGRYIVSGSNDRVIRLWDVQACRRLAETANDWEHTPGVDDLSRASPTISHLPMNSRALGPSQSYTHSWKLNEEGWVLDHDSHLLLWVPPDLRSRLKRPGNPILISHQGSVQLDFSNARIGNFWEECYSLPQ